jgi:hypothetical protein
MVADRAFDFGRIDILAAGDDHVLDAVVTFVFLPRHLLVIARSAGDEAIQFALDASPMESSLRSQ